MGIQLQSVIFEEASVQVSYYDDEGKNEAGLKIITIVVNPFVVKTELKDLVDSVEQLIAAWEGAWREKALPVPSPRR